MRSRGFMFIGILLIFFGLLALVSNLTGIEFGNFCFPVGLILIGVWVLARPRMVKSGAQVEFNILGEHKRSGVWAVKPVEIWSGVGEVKLDFTQAEVPPGETRIHIYSLVGDIMLRPGANMGLQLTANGLVNSIKWMGAKQDNFLNSVQLTNPEFAQADRKLFVEVTALIGDIKVIPPGDIG
jgi:predicted membrane protein